MSTLTINNALITTLSFDFQCIGQPCGQADCEICTLTNQLLPVNNYTSFQGDVFLQIELDYR